MRADHKSILDRLEAMLAFGRPARRRGSSRRLCSNSSTSAPRRRMAALTTWTCTRRTPACEVRTSSGRTNRRLAPGALYSPRDQVARAWCEALSLLSQAAATSDVYADAAAQFSPEETAALTFQIAAIYDWNRLAVGLRTPVSAYASPFPAAADATGMSRED